MNQPAFCDDPCTTAVAGGHHNVVDDDTTGDSHTANNKYSDLRIFNVTKRRVQLETKEVCINMRQPAFPNQENSPFFYWPMHAPEVSTKFYSVVYDKKENDSF